MLMAERVPIGPDTDAGALHDRLARLGADLLLRALGGLERGSVTPTPQPEDGVTYATKIDKAETRIDWARPAAELDRLVRAMSPSPGAWCQVADSRVRVLRAVPEPGGGAPPGALLDDSLLVACGDGALRLTRVQREGRQPMDAETFLRGFPLSAGGRLG
jgi:methionyl-tRNA formyltransferase